MSFKTTTSQILGDFATKLAGSSFSATPVAYPNVPFEQPSRSPWMVINVIPGTSRRRTIGGATNRWSQTGGVTVQVKVPEGEGTGDLYDIVETVASFFRDAETENVLFRRVIVTEIGPVDGWYQANVTVTYEDSYLF